MISLRPIDGLLTRALLTAVLLTISTVASSRSGECVDTSEFAHWIGGTSTVGDAIGVDVVDGIAYVADGNSGLTLIDVTDPTSPVLVANHALPGRAYEVEVSGGYAYVACGFAGLVTVDVTDPGALDTVSTRPTDGSARALDIVDDLLVLAISRTTPGGWLETYDLGIPSFPIKRGQIATPRRANDVRLRDGIAYVTTLWCDEDTCVGGFGTFDVTDPTVPDKVGWLGVGPVNGVALDGDLAYVSSEVWGLQVLDIADPTFIRLVRNEGGFEGHGVDHRDGVVLIAAEELALIDATDPGDPLFFGSVPSPPDGPTDTATRIRVVDDLAYVTGSGRLNVVRVTIPDLVMADDLLPATTSAGAVTRIDAGLAAITDGADLVTVDIGPDLLTERGRITFGDLAIDVAAVGSVALVAAGDAGVRPVDCSDPDLPVAADAVGLGRRADAIATGAGLALVGASADGEGALVVLDLTDPLAPHVAGELLLPDAVDAIAVRPVAGTAVILSGGAVLEVSLDPMSTPTVVASFDPPGSPRALVATARYAMVAGTAGLTVIDLKARELVSTRELPGLAASIALRDDRLLVGMGDDGVAVLDAGDPRAPVPIGLLDADGVTDLTFDDAWTLVALGPGGIARFPGACAAVGVDAPDMVPVAGRPTIRPNPFRVAAVVEFDLSAPGRVDATVFDPAGRSVRDLSGSAWLPAGAHRLHWDGTTDDGVAVGPGVYFIRVRTPDRTLTGSVVHGG